MDIYDIFSDFLRFLYRLPVAIIDFILRKLRLGSLRGSVTLHALYVVHLWVYYNVLQEKGVAQSTDPVIACCTCVSGIITVRFVASLYGTHLYHAATSVARRVAMYGWKRCIIYGVSLVLVAACLVCLFSSLLRLSWSGVSDEVLGRLDNNIVHIEEDRSHYAKVMVHPATQGKSDPKLFHQLFRYPMEDVEMRCHVNMRWLSDSRPTADQIAWRRNGGPVKFTDRHDHEVTFREIPEHESRYHSLLRERGVSEYEINATLTIRLLQDNEFGTYTCHAAKYMECSLEDYDANMRKLNNKTTDKNESTGKSSKTKRAAQASVEETQLIEQERLRLAKERLTAIDIKRLFRDTFTWKHEFRLVKLQRRQETIRSPPSSILSLTTSYWHLSSQDGIEVDYTVNGKSFTDLCPGYFHGCSKALLLYWLFGHNKGHFGAPPLHLFSVWKNPAIPADRFTLLHCLCENAYGYHRVRYLRRYYNRTTERHELMEITHPHTLIVVPREQHLLNVFKNRSECSHVIEPPPCEHVPPVCLSGWDFRLIRELAEIAVKFFHWTEWAFLLIAIVVGLLLIIYTNGFLSWLGRQIAALTLDGSMTFFYTAVSSTTQQDMHLSATSNNNNCLISKLIYDVFMSYSDTEADTRKVHEEVLPVLERKGIAVCARARDLPPNKPEVQGVSDATERSKRAVIFLSEAYLSDTFRTDIEAPTIMESFSASGSERGLHQVLLVKLESCEVPLWLSQLPLHDWTPACLTLQDHLLRLLKWLEPAEQRQSFRSLQDVGVTLSPILFTLLIATLCLSQRLFAAQVSE